MATKVYKFKATGGFDIDKKLKQVLSFDNQVVGFELPDGRTVRLIIALEVESKDGDIYKYITSEREMAKVGFEGLDYDELIFEEC